MSEVTSGGFLTLNNLISRQESDQIFDIEGYSHQDIIQMLKNQSQNNSVVVDLELGDEYYLSGENYPKKLENPQMSHIVIEPGEFALLTTRAKFNIPSDVIAFISMRFRQSLKGLINISGFHVDPGYSGRIIFSVYNAGPNKIVLERHESVFMIIFSQLGQNVPVHEDKKFHNIDRITPEHIQGLSGEPVSLRSMDKRVKKLENLAKVLYAVGVTLGGTVVYLLVDIFQNQGVGPNP